jgi:hypothetical protein
MLYEFFSIDWIAKTWGLAEGGSLGDSGILRRKSDQHVYFYDAFI